MLVVECFPISSVHISAVSSNSFCDFAFNCRHGLLLNSQMQAVIDFLKTNEPRYINELCDYVRFPSVSAQPQHRADVEACAQWLVNRCQQAGLTTRLYPTAGNPIVVAKTPAAKSASTRRPRFVLYGHYDVQPPEPFELWKSPPFEPRIEGRSLFGRGASDNKGQNLA